MDSNGVSTNTLHRIGEHGASRAYGGGSVQDGASTHDAANHELAQPDQEAVMMEI